MGIYAQYDIPSMIRGEFPLIRPKRKMEEAIMAGRNVFLSAPKGYGKTVSMANLARCLENHPDWHASWISLKVDDLDDEPFDFLSTVFESLLNSNDPDLQDVAKAGESRTGRREQIAFLESSLSSIPGKVAIFFDGIEVLHGTEFADEIGRFSLAMPNNAVVVMSGRFNPGIGLYQMKAEERVVELGESDFSLHPEEIIEFFAHHKVRFSKVYAESLYKVTSGWIMVLRMIAVIVSENPQAKANLETDAHLRSWVAEYLDYGTATVVGSEAKAFAQRMSIIGSFDEAMASHITHDDNVAHYIRILFSENVLVRVQNPLSYGAVLFRVNPLFSKEIKERAFANFPREELDRLGGISLEWQLSRGHYVGAISIALELGRSDDAFRIMADHFYEVLSRESGTTLMGWLQEIPFPDDEYAYLYCIAIAWTSFVNGRTRRAIKWLNKAKDARALSARDELKGADNVYDTVMVGTLVFSGHYEEAIELGRKTVSRLGGGPQLFLRATILHNMGEALVRIGRYDEAYETFARARIDAEISGRMVVNILCTCEMASIHSIRGKLDAASNLLLKAMSEHDREEIVAYTPIALLWICLARIYYYWGDFDRAQEIIDQALPYLSPLKNRDMWIDAQTLNAQIKMCEGLPDEARDLLIEVYEMIGIDHVPRGINLYSLAAIAECYITLGDIGHAKALLREMTSIAHADDIVIQLRIAYLSARIELTEGQAETAISKLNRSSSYAKQSDLALTAIECDTILACTMLAAGDEDSAVDKLASALQRASDESIACIFEKEYPGIHVLLYRVAHSRNDNKAIVNERVDAREFAEKIIALRENRKGGAEWKSYSDSDIQDLQADLSPREIEIYGLLKQGKTRREISEELDIKLNTVRTHVHNIYRKTGIHDRSLL